MTEEKLLPREDEELSLAQEIEKALFRIISLGRYTPRKSPVVREERNQLSREVYAYLIYGKREIGDTLLNKLAVKIREMNQTWDILTVPPNGRSRSDTKKIEAQEGAKILARELGIPFSACLKREETTIRCTSDLKGKSVLLYDDIVQTGATLRKAIGALMEKGAENIQPCVLAVGKTLERPQVSVEKDMDRTPYNSELEKGIRPAFGSPGGKRFLAKRICSYIPEHKTYVEPFVGSGAIFFTKDPSTIEMINDKDPEIIFLFRFIKNMTQQDYEFMGKLNWVCSESNFNKLKELETLDNRKKFQKILLLRVWSYGQNSKRFSRRDRVGTDYKKTLLPRLWKIKERLTNTRIKNLDYSFLVKRFDSKDAFFYLDPPYPSKSNFKEFRMDLEKLKRDLENLRGQFILSFEDTKLGNKLFKNFHIKRIKVARTFPGGGLDKQATELLISNFSLKPIYRYISKSLVEEEERIVHEWGKSNGFNKGIRPAFGSPGGKKFLANRICSYIPDHKTYAELFAGGAAVFFKKQPSELEVLNDKNPEIVFAYRFIKYHIARDREKLRRFDWSCKETLFDRVKETQPRNVIERFRKFLYLNKFIYLRCFSFGFLGEKISPAAREAGRTTHIIERLERLQKRLRGVKIHCKDYKAVVERYDSPNTFFYLDPPYPSNPKGMQSGKFDYERFFESLHRIKGKFILSFEDVKDRAPFKGFRIRTVKVRTTQGLTPNTEFRRELLISNFPLKPVYKYISKSLVEEEGRCEREMTEKKSINFNFPIEISKHYTEDEKWFVEGFAATTDFDLQGDVIEEECLKNSEKDLLENSTVLFNHNDNQPIGTVVQCKAQKTGLWVKVLISQTVPDIWQKIKEGVLSKFSIRGKVMRAIKRFMEALGKVANIIQEMYLVECSLVSVPANPKARTISWYVSKALQEFETNGGVIELEDDESIEESEGEPEITSVEANQNKSEEDLKTQKKEEVKEVAEKEKKENSEEPEKKEEAKEKAKEEETKEEKSKEPSQEEKEKEKEETPKEEEAEDEKDKEYPYPYPYPISAGKVKEIMLLLDKLITKEKDEKVKAILQEIKAMVSRLTGEKYPYPEAYPYPKKELEDIAERLSNVEDLISELNIEDIAKVLEEIKEKISQKEASKKEEVEEEEKKEDKTPEEKEEKGPKETQKKEAEKKEEIIRKGKIIPSPYEEKEKKAEENKTNDKGWSKLIFR